MFSDFDPVRDYTPEGLSYVDTAAEKVAAYVNDTVNIFKGIYPVSGGAGPGAGMGILEKFGLLKQDPGLAGGQQAAELKNDRIEQDPDRTGGTLPDKLEKVSVDIQDGMSEVQNVGLEVVNLRCLISQMNQAAKTGEQGLYTQGVEPFDNALTAMEADAEILQAMFARGAIAAARQRIDVPTGNCTAEEEFGFKRQLVEFMTSEENKGGEAA